MNARLRGAALCLAPACLLSCGGDVTPPRENGLPILAAVSITLSEDSDVLVDVLAAAEDPDGQPLEIVSFTTPSHGSVAREGSALRYTPPANYHGPDAFDVTIGDTEGGRVTGSVAVSVLPVNDAPAALDDAANLQEDTPQLLDVLANDTDVDGDGLVVSVVVAPVNGEAVVQAAALRYTPAADYSGEDSLRYAATDRDGLADTAWVRLTILPANDRPVAADDSATTLEDESVRVDVLANDSDPDGDPLGIDSFTQGARGTVITDVTGLLYVPAAEACGSDAFSYIGSDGEGGLDTAAVRVTITCVNDAPAAVDDSASVDEDGTTLLDVRANDVDVDGDVLQVVAVTPPAHGTAAVEDGQVRYTPEPDYAGPDAFDYVVSDGRATDTATVHVTVTAIPNTPPAPADDDGTVPEDSSATFDVLANDSDADGDSLFISGVSSPGHGSVSVVAGGIRYTATDPNYHGPDAFTYTASDGESGVAASVRVTITPVNDPPAAVGDEATVEQDGSVLVDVFANDVDVDGDDLVPGGTTAHPDGLIQPAHGTAAWDGGQLRYTPDPGYAGPDSLDYFVSDGTVTGSGATVRITVTDVNDAPVATDDAATTDEDVPVLIDVRANDTDVDGDALTVSAVFDPANGVAGVAADGSGVWFTPDANTNRDHATHTVSYEVSDGRGGVDTALVTIDVAPVNDAPVAQPDSGTLDHGTSALIDVLANDMDIDGDALTISGFDQPAHGTTALEGGQIRYTPEPTYDGADAFSYVASDGNGGVDTAAVSLTVVYVNAAPTTTRDSLRVQQASSQLIDVLANDSDPDGDALTLTAVYPQEAGSAAVEGNQVRYTPATAFWGLERIEYEVSDGNGGTARDTLAVHVNGAPVGVADVASGAEDAVLLVEVLLNDSDPEGIIPLEITSFTQGAHGTVTLTEGRPELDLDRLDYTPAPDWYGTDTFTYDIVDVYGGTASGIQVTLTVNPVNDPPVAVVDSFVVNEDQEAVLQVLGNDSDTEGDSFFISDLSTANVGTVQNLGTTIRYTPPANFVGTDAFSYQISDGSATSAFASVHIAVLDVNDPPAAENDLASVIEDETVLIDVLANDTDPENDALTITQILGGDLFAYPGIEDGQIRYTPHPDVNRDNSSHQLRYVVSDGRGGVDTAWVNVDVVPVDDPPVAVDDVATVDEDSTVMIVVTANDPNPDWPTDGLTVTGFTQGAHGTVTEALDLIYYTPDADWHGTDSFTYTISDGNTEDTGTVTVTVNPVNDVPVAVDDAATVEEDGSVLVDVMANDYDVDGYPVFVASVHDVQNGSAYVTSGGAAVQFTPTPDFHGTASFSYVLADASHGAADTATVTVTVTPVNDPPVAVDDAATVAEDGSVLIDVQANDSDPDGDPLFFLGAYSPVNGSVASEGFPTQVRFTPTPDFNGTAVFYYQIADETPGSIDSAMVTVTVTPVPDAPVVSDTTITILQDQGGGAYIDSNLLFSDADPGDYGSLESFTQPAAGTGTVTQEGDAVRYTPPAGWTGTTTFTVTMRDGTGLTATGTVTMIVEPDGPS